MRAQDDERYGVPVTEASARVTSALERLRWIGKIEGVSFLILLGIAMPLKYLAGLPLAVKVVGWAHGVLFITFIAALWSAWRNGLPLRLSALVFIASLLPFGPFLIDSRLARHANG